MNSKNLCGYTSSVQCRLLHFPQPALISISSFLCWVSTLYALFTIRYIPQESGHEVPILVFCIGFLSPRASHSVKFGSYGSLRRVKQAEKASTDKQLPRNLNRTGDNSLTMVHLLAKYDLTEEIIFCLLPLPWMVYYLFFRCLRTLRPYTLHVHWHCLRNKILFLIISV